MTKASGPAPSEGKFSLADRMLASAARRFLARVSDPLTAEFVANLLANRPVFNAMSDRQIALTAEALKGQGYFASRLIARLPAEQAGQIAVDRFVRFDALSSVGDAAIDRLADVLTGDTRFMNAAVARAIANDSISDEHAADIVRGRLEKRGGGVSQAAIAPLANALASDATFLGAVLDEALADDRFSDERAISTVMGLLAKRGIARRSLAMALDRVLVGDLMARKSVMEIMLSRFVQHGGTRTLPDAEVGPLVKALKTDSRFLKGTLKAAIASEQTLLAQVDPVTASEVAIAVFSDPAFPEVLVADAEKLPITQIRRVARALSETHRPLVEEQLRDATPDIGFRVESYAQEGEDMVLDRIYTGRNTGFFVDIGALHPIRFSNTYLMYRKGWRGINVDATPGSMELFNKLRPEDINIEALVTGDTRTYTYYMMNEPALNTMSEELANLRATENAAYRIVGTKTMQSRTLADILDEHVPANTTIDFFTIDVEGADMDVLRSNDWKRYRPHLVLAELLTTSMRDLDKHEITAFLAEQGYAPYAKQFNTVFFIAEQAQP